MKSVVKNTAFAVLLVLTLCTIAAYHIEQLALIAEQTGDWYFAQTR